MRGLGEIFGLVKEEHRMGPLHIAMYFAILSVWEEGSRPEWMQLERRELMVRAKIGSKNTFYRVMRELAEVGVIEYRPVRVRGRSLVRVWLSFIKG